MRKPTKWTTKQKLWSKPERSYDPIESTSKKTFTCPTCYQLFSPTKLYQMFCREECEEKANEEMAKIRVNRLDAHCGKCGIKFRRIDEKKPQVICDGCKHQSQKLIYQKKRIVEWKEKKKPAPISYEELNRREEYKRVFDEKGWSHYCKGRKWDRI